MQSQEEFIKEKYMEYILELLWLKTDKDTPFMEWRQKMIDTFLQEKLPALKGVKIIKV